MNIKDILILKGSISLPYKTEMDEWFGDVKLIVYETFKTYYVVSYYDTKKFEDIDESIEYFKEIALSDKNIGIKQRIWSSLYPNKDPEDIDIDILEKEVRDINIKDYYED